jgi:hypothetical protein
LTVSVAPGDRDAVDTIVALELAVLAADIAPISVPAPVTTP